MKKGTSRAIVGYLAMIATYVVFGLTQWPKIQAASNDFLQYGLVFLIAALSAGAVAGLIAPYSYGKVIKYELITLVVPAIGGGILLLTMGQAFAEVRDSWAGIFVLIVIIIFALALAVALGATALGSIVGAKIGSLIGKNFCADYRLDDYPAKEPFSEPTL